jgi:hypothetical protein
VRGAGLDVFEVGAAASSDDHAAPSQLTAELCSLFLLCGGTARAQGASGPAHVPIGHAPASHRHRHYRSPIRHVRTSPRLPRHAPRHRTRTRTRTRTTQLLMFLLWPLFGHASCCSSRTSRRCSKAGRRPQRSTRSAPNKRKIISSFHLSLHS